MAFVDDQQGVFRQIFEQALAAVHRRLAPGQVARIILDARAVANFDHHLDIEARALFQALGFDELAGARVGLIESLDQFDFDRFDGIQHGLTRGDVVRFGIDRQARHACAALRRLADRNRINDSTSVIEQFDTHRVALGFGRKDVDDFAAHAIGAADQIHVVTRVLQLREASQDRALIDRVAPLAQVQHHAVIFVRIAQTVNRRDRRHDDRVATFHQRFGRGQAHLLNVVVDRGVFLYIRCLTPARRLPADSNRNKTRNIPRHCSGRNRAFRRRAGPPASYSARAQSPGRCIWLDDVGNRVGFARTRDPQQGLVRKPAVTPSTSFRSPPVGHRQG